MWRVLRLIVWPVVLFLIAVGVSAWYSYKPSKDPEHFITDTVRKGEIEETVSAIGNIQPLEYVDVGTQVTGPLKRLYFAIGDDVKKGNLLAEIDPTLLMSKAQGTRATLRNLQAQLDEKQVVQRLNELSNERNRELYGKGAASQESLQQGAASVQQARAQVAALRAQIDQTQSQLQGDDANLRYTKFYAPMSGTIVSLTAREGQTLVASQQTQTILRIANLGTMTVWAQVSEADVPKIAIGMPVYFNTLGSVGRLWEGKVRQILPTPELINDVVLYNVLFDVPNPDRALKTQMSAQVYFVLGRVADALVVPSAALKPFRGAKDGDNDKGGAEPGQDESQKRMYTVQVLKGAKATNRSVKVGLMNRLSAQLLSGLNEGETVILGVEKSK